MIEAIDRLSDEWFSDSELEALHKAVLTNQEYSKSKHIVLYGIHLEGVPTGIATMLAVESIADGLTALNWFLGSLNMHATLVAHSEESIVNGYKIDALRVVLDKFKYVSKLEFHGADKLYIYHKWMDQLICD
jgi:hypothetical protein